MRKLLEDKAERTGQRAPELDGPECPPGLDYVWHWFLELAATRKGGGFGPERIGYADIDAWSRLTGCDPNPFEVGCLTGIDLKYFEKPVAVTDAPVILSKPGF